MKQATMFGIPLLAHPDVPDDEVWLCDGAAEHCMEIEGPTLRVTLRWPKRVIGTLQPPNARGHREG